jgi:hypothetical protein
MLMSRKRLLLLWEIISMGKLLKWQNDKIASSKNAILMRLAVDKMGILLNCCLTKYQVDETSSRLNSKKERLTK